MSENKKPNKKQIKEMAAYFGSMGGKATVKKYGKNYMIELAKKGAKKRWSKNK